ncbi:MAG: hypothetical protein KDB80_10645, partial [Planctomycetes bacterium]|nr:hypothetical protein [Planctomycetota bacterium]
DDLHRHAGDRTVTQDRGFALLALLIAIASASSLLLAALPLLDPAERCAGHETWSRLTRIRARAASAVRASASIPKTLDSLASIQPIGDTHSWRRDPYGAEDFAYTVTGTPETLTLSSAGPDRRRNTADDLMIALDAAVEQRARTRSRIRIIRAAFLRSAFMHDPGMSGADAAAMRTHVRDYATAQRSLAHSSGDAHDSLIVKRDTARSAILDMRATYMLPSPPSAISGPGGLLSALSLPDSLDADGFGNPLVANDAVGCVSTGADAIGGTDDDL